MAIRLPLIRPELDPVDHIEIPTPCSVPWDSMYGDQRIRHCGSCRKNVYNVAELTRAQAMALITSRERVCLRIYRRPDGTVVTNDCWSRLRAARRQGMWAFVVMLVIVAWAQVAAMFVGLAGLRRLIPHRAMGSPPVTAAATVTPRMEPPVPSGYTVTAGVPPEPDPRAEPARRHRREKHGRSVKGAYYVAGGI